MSFIESSKERISSLGPQAKGKASSAYLLNEGGNLCSTKRVSASAQLEHEVIISE